MRGDRWSASDLVALALAILAFMIAIYVMIP